MVEAKFRYFVIVLSKAYFKMYLNHLHLTLSLDISDINWHAALIIGCFESSLKTFFKHGELQDKIPLVTFQYFKHHFQMSSQSQRHIQNSNVDKVKVTPTDQEHGVRFIDILPKANFTTLWHSLLRTLQYRNGNLSVKLF